MLARRIQKASKSTKKRPCYGCGSSNALKNAQKSLGKNFRRCDSCCDKALAVIRAADNDDAQAEPIVGLQFDPQFTHLWSCKCRPGPGDCHPDLIDPGTNCPFVPVVDDKGYWQHPTEVLSCGFCKVHSKGDITQAEAIQIKLRAAVQNRMKATGEAPKWHKAHRKEMTGGGKNKAVMTPYVIRQSDASNFVFDAEGLLLLEEYGQFPVKERMIADRLTREELEGVHVVLLTPAAFEQ